MTTRIRGELRRWHKQGEVYTGESYGDSTHMTPDGQTLILKPTDVRSFNEGHILYVESGTVTDAYYALYSHKKGTLF